MGLMPELTGRSIKHSIATNVDESLSIACRVEWVVGLRVEGNRPSTDAALVQSHHMLFSYHFPLSLIARPLLPVRCKQDY